MSDEIPWDAEAELSERLGPDAVRVIGRGPLREMVKAAGPLGDQDIRITFADPAVAAVHGEVGADIIRRYVGLILSGDAG